MTSEKGLVTDAQALKLLKEATEFSRSLGPDYAVATREEYEEAAELLKKVKGKEKDLESRRVYLKAPSLEAGRRIDEFFKQPLAFLRGIESQVKKAMLSFRTEQERKAAELQALADKAAAEEQRRLARVALEERMKADREAQELTQKAREERDRLRREELLQEARARQERAQEAGAQLEAEADRLQAPVIVAEKPKIDGQTVRKVWRWKIEDFSLVPDEYKVLDDQALRLYLQGRPVKIEGGRIVKVAPEAIPGLSFYEAEVIASEGI